MAILDPPSGLTDQEILAWRTNNIDPSPFATLYWPWIQVKDPLSGTTIEIPPCGHVAGAWAGTDGQRNQILPRNTAGLIVVSWTWSANWPAGSASSGTGANSAKAAEEAHWRCYRPTA